MWPVLAGLIGAGLTAAVTFYLGKRGKSGRIDTSEAKDLWDTMRAELSRVSTEAAELRAEVNVARLEMVALREESVRVRSYIAELEAKVATLTAQEKRLRRALKSAGIKQYA